MFSDRWFGKRYYGNRYFGPHGADDATAMHQPGGGFYRRPIKYVRDGKIVDLNEAPPEPFAELAEWPELSSTVIEALLAGLPVEQPQPIDRAAILERKMGQMMIQRHLQEMAEDDAMTVLLLS